jgi:hypothetical protein
MYPPDKPEVHDVNAWISHRKLYHRKGFRMKKPIITVKKQNVIALCNVKTGVSRQPRRSKIGYDRRYAAGRTIFSVSSSQASQTTISS